MLMKAIYLANNGFNVKVLDNDPIPGGVWKPFKFKSLNLDSTCHCIESFPYVYKILEKYSDVKFETRRHQPFRVTINGSIKHHYCKTNLIKRSWNTIGQILGSLILIPKLKRVQGVAFCEDIKTSSKTLKLMIYRLLKGSNTKHPVGGCVEFLRGLVLQCKKLDVRFIQGKADLVRAKQDHSLEILLKSKEKLAVNQIYCSSSVLCSVTFPSGNRKIFKHSSKKNQYYGLYEIKMTSRPSVSYVTFPDDNEIKRLSVLDSFDAIEYFNGTNNLFLSIQFSKLVETEGERLKLLAANLKKIFGFSLFEILKEISYEEKSYFTKQDYSFMKNSDSFKNFRVLDTIGCLSESVFNEVENFNGL